MGLCNVLKAYCDFVISKRVHVLCVVCILVTHFYLGVGLNMSRFVSCRFVCLCCFREHTCCAYSYGTFILACHLLCHLQFHSCSPEWHCHFGLIAEQHCSQDIEFDSLQSAVLSKVQGDQFIGEAMFAALLSQMAMLMMIFQSRF